MTFKGTFNAATGAISSPGSGQLYTGSTGGIAITKGDFYIADTAGSFYGTTAMNVGDEAIALNTVAAAPPGSTVSDWSVVPAQSSGGTVTGTGAATQVTFWDGTSNVNGDTAFNWDNTNKRLGIGTSTFPYNPKTSIAASSSPLNTLAVQTTDVVTGTTGTILYTGLGASTGNTYGSIRAFTTGGTVNADLVLQNGSGNVGIGATTPDTLLHIKGASSGAYIASTIENTNVNGYVKQDFQIGTSHASISYAKGLFFAIGPDINDTTTPIVFRNNNAVEKMRITVAGGVSFGSSGIAYGAAGEVLTSNDNAPPTWQAAGGGASTITTNNFPGNATVGPFTLGAAPSGGSKSFVDVFIDGVYQEITTYGVTGTALTFVTAVPSGVTIETKTTSGNVSGALVSSVDIGQSNTVGNVDLRINPIEVPSGTTPTGIANSLYIFTSTTGSISTLTLPASPTAGDSIKISNIGGLANVIATSGTDKIMGQAGPMTIDVTNAAFEMIWSNIAAQGWIIIGNV